MPTERKRLSAAPLRASINGQAQQAQARATFQEAAEAHALAALEALAWLAQNANSEAARVSAANAVLDRAHGKPSPGVRPLDQDGDADGEDGRLVVRWLDRS